MPMMAVAAAKVDGEPGTDALNDSLSRTTGASLVFYDLLQHADSFRKRLEPP